MYGRVSRPDESWRVEEKVDIGGRNDDLDKVDMESSYTVEH